MNLGFSGFRRLRAGVLPVLWACWALVVASGAPVAPVNWSALSADKAAPNQLLVRFHPARAVRSSATGPRVLATHQLLGAKVEHEFRRISWQVVTVPASVGLASAAAQYARDPAVTAVEPNYRVQALATPNDPDYGQLWGMERINAPLAWDATTGSDQVVVAVIDSGIRYTHEDLAANMWVNPGEIPGNGIDDDGNGFVDDVHGINAIVGSGDPMDDNGHGTHVAGTVGAVGDNALGVAGVNWNVRLMALKFLGADGYGEIADAVVALEYAIDHGAHLSCNSWGGGGASQAMADMIAAAGAANQLFIAAAGNEGSDNDTVPHYPSSYENDNIVAVAAIDASGLLAGFSCYGAVSVDLAAPGVEIHSSTFDSDSSYGALSGTSMATPHVAGAAALLLSLYPAATYAEIRDALFDSARANPSLAGRMVTGGELDLAAAVSEVSGAVTLDRLAYRSDATVHVTVFDAVVDAGTTDVAISWRTTAPDQTVRHEEPMTLLRDGVSPLFTGSFTLQSGVSAVHGDLLTVSYTTTGGETNAVSAPIDDIPPQLLNLRFEEKSDDRLMLRWETDEPATTGAALGTNAPPAGYLQERSDWTTNHVAIFEGLPSFTAFYAAAWSEDPAGNRATFPADTNSTDTADYLPGVTRGQTRLYETDFENGASGWSAASLLSGGDVCWEYGVPSFGPTPATRCWGTRLDGPYPALAIAELVSPPFQVGDQPSLHFSHWFDMEPWNSEYDTGRVEVYVDGGWHNVTPYADQAPGAQSFSGAGDWQDLRIRLPHATFGNKLLRVRFLFQSGAAGLDGFNPAGWFIDNFAVSEVQDQGVLWSHLTLLDAVPGGDGDGFPEAGETVELGLRILNITGGTLTNLSGRLLVRAEGPGALQPLLLNGSPALLEYGDVPTEAFADALPAAPLRLLLPPGMAPGTVLSLLQTLVDGQGRVYETRAKLILQPPGPVLGEGTPTLRAFTTGQVTDGRGIPLPGAGDPAAALFQVLWAGPDGVADPPALDGAPTGDDALLAVHASGLPHERFGTGYEATPDVGRFDQVFRHAVLPGAPASNLYVRAWDAASFESAIAYGDSHLYSLTLAPGEEHDFGSWSATNLLRPARDSNGDGIPDGWMIENRPDLVPRAPAAPLDSVGLYAGKVSVPALYSDQAEPVQVAATDKLLFALDKINNRIVVFDRTTLALKQTFGGGGKAQGQFAQPEGMALDPGTNRLAVADTQNHRVQVFTFDPDSGAIAFAFAFGVSKSAVPGHFDSPRGIDIERDTGNLYVADTGNRRLQGFNPDGTLLYVGGYPVLIFGSGDFELKGPQGIAVDPDHGIFVVDAEGSTDVDRVLRFAHDGAPLAFFGTHGGADGQFNWPLDIRLWRQTPLNPADPVVTRLCVADSENGRIQLFSLDGTHLANVGLSGEEGNGYLSDPAGCFPVADSNLLYVADTGNNRLQWFGVTLDADGDGMDDFWEDRNGLDSSDPADADEDPDGDGLPNGSEFVARTDPNDPDSDDDGLGDLDDFYAGLVPAGPEAPLYVALSAHTNQLAAGETVVLTAVVSPGLPPEAELWLTLSGASPLDARLMQTADGTNFVYSHQTTAGQAGWTDGDLFCWHVQGQAYAQTNLFELAGGEPPPPMDPFPILAIAVNPPELTWDAVVGGTYRIERASALVPAPIVWTLVNTVVADNVIMTEPIPTDLPVAYFRVVRTE